MKANGKFRMTGELLNHLVFSTQPVQIKHLKYNPDNDTYDFFVYSELFPNCLEGEEIPYKTKELNMAMQKDLAF